MESKFFYCGDRGMKMPYGSGLNIMQPIYRGGAWCKKFY